MTHPQNGGVRGEISPPCDRRSSTAGSLSTATEAGLAARWGCVLYYNHHPSSGQEARSVLDICPCSRHTVPWTAHRWVGKGSSGESAGRCSLGVSAHLALSGLGKAAETQQSMLENRKACSLMREDFRRQGEVLMARTDSGSLFLSCTLRKRAPLVPTASTLTGPTWAPAWMWFRHTEMLIAERMPFPFGFPPRENRADPEVCRALARGGQPLSARDLLLLAQGGCSGTQSWGYGE